MAVVADNNSTRSEGFVARDLRIPFILLVLCFTAWGAAANLTDILVGVFRGIFDMSNFQSSLVQSAYYGAYFLLALPAGFINKRYGYKTGVLVGLGLAAAGGLMFLPASQLLVYEMFLLALFALAAGLSILETSANPFVIAMGEESTATQRLNLAQAFNPIGANIGVLMGAVFILPALTPETSKAIMSELAVARQSGGGSGACTQALSRNRLGAGGDLAADLLPEVRIAEGGGRDWRRYPFGQRRGAAVEKPALPLWGDGPVL